MIPIQEIHIYSGCGVKVSADIVVPNLQNPISGAEVVIYDPRCNALYSTYHKIGEYSNPCAAYQAIIEFSKKYIENAGGRVERINNPYNTEFVGIQEQQGMVDALSLGVTVELNA